VYIENQYITSKVACEALAERMRANEALEAIVLTTREPGGWLEAEIMGVGRQHFMAAFAAPALAQRIQFVAPIARCGPARRTAAAAPDGAEQELSIHVHAKVLIVDDTFLRVGSSNLNNRSMGLDTECDVGIEGTTPAHRRAIAAVRNRLIAEHWGSDAESVAEALEVDEPVRSALAQLPCVPVFSTTHARHPRLTPWRRAARAPAVRSVVPIERDEAAGIDLVVQLGDPERAVSAEQLVAEAAGLGDPRPVARWGVLLLVTVASITALLFGLDRLDFSFSAVANGIVGGIEALAANPWRVPIVLAAFVLGSVVAVPILALIGATVVALGPVLGFVCSAAGVLLAASTTFGVGRLIGRQPLRRWLGAKFETLERRFATRGVIAVALIRKVPVAPFTVVNMLIGAVGVRYRDFIIGTALGMLPGIAAFAFVSDRVVDAWRDPTANNVALIAGAILAWILVVIGVQRALNRHAAR
jgi:uncharacterized membrane protein YdjX (TVP38/TMEM64 family)